MPHNPVTQRIFEIIRNAVSIFVLIIVFFILEYIFNVHFICSCKPGLHHYGIEYLLLPPVILTLVVNIVERFHQRDVFYITHCVSKPGCISHFIWYLLMLILKYAGLTAVWIATVLFDGDWYFCVMTNLNSNQIGMPCRKNLTYEEQRIHDEYKTQSLACGLYLTCGFLLIWNIFEFSKTFHRSICQCCTPYYSVLYKDLLDEQVNRLLNEELKEIATDKATEICKPYLEAIRKHELPAQNEDANFSNISDPWKNISSSGFYWTEHERIESASAMDPGGQDT